MIFFKLENNKFNKMIISFVILIFYSLKAKDKYVINSVSFIWLHHLNIYLNQIKFKIHHMSYNNILHC